MFTGIIQEIGEIRSIKHGENISTLEIFAPKSGQELNIGSSISIDGACLTVTKKTPTTWCVEVMRETLKMTIIKNYSEGQKVNIEPSLKINDRLDGHIVSGHVDFTGKVEKTHNEGETKILTVSFPEETAKYFAFKGSVTINGVSLTISLLQSNNFEINLIPHTQKTTNLGLLKKDDLVNVEIDILARYIESLLKEKEGQTTYEFLQKRGFI